MISRLVAAGCVLSIACAGCNPIQPAADPLKPTTSKEAFEGSQCNVVRPPTEPDLMGWDPGSRANLSRLSRNGVVAVKYVARGCNVELEVIPTCIAMGASYEFAPYSANERKIARNDAELYAALPIGAARLTGRLKGDRALRTDYMLTGTLSLPPVITSESMRLEGSGCSQATHLVSAIYVGGFGLAAGEKRQIEGGAVVFGAGGGARSSAEVETLANEGNAEACSAAQRDRKRDDGCAVPLRIALLQIRGAGGGGGVATSPRASDVGGGSGAGSSEASPPPTADVAPKSGEPGRSPLPFVLGGAGVAAIGAGVVFTILGANAKSDLESTCAPRCAPDDESAASTKSTIGLVSLIGGGLLVGGGVAWYLLDPGAQKKAASLHVTPSASPQFSGLVLRGTL